MEPTKHADRMIGESSNFLQMQEQVSRLAPLSKPVLIIGERGTGKELVAARLHYLSPRWDENFLKINCAAFNEALLDSQLFGHETGAFTGATKQQKGLFERAHRGTLFLDELANTSMAVQEKILRVTEYGELERLGGHHPVDINVRIVAAANVDLPELAAQGRFRQDLLDRLAFDVITLPPLRERQEDIEVLAQHFAVNMVKEMGGEYFAGFSKTAMQDLLNYPWPGNVRELKNVVERCVYRCENPKATVKKIVFDPFDSPYRLWTKNRTKATPETTGHTSETSSHLAEAGLSGGSVRPNGIREHRTERTLTDSAGFKAQVQVFEKTLLHQALQKHQFNQRATAKALGLSYDQLRGYLRKHQLTRS